MARKKKTLEEKTNDLLVEIKEGKSINTAQDINLFNECFYEENVFFVGEPKNVFYKQTIDWECLVAQGFKRAITFEKLTESEVVSLVENYLTREDAE